MYTEPKKPIPVPRQNLSGKNNGGTRQGNQPSGENSQSSKTECVIVNRKRNVDDPPVSSTEITSETTGENNKDAKEVCGEGKVINTIESLKQCGLKI